MGGRASFRGTFLWVVVGAIAALDASALQRTSSAPAPPITVDIKVQSEQKISDTAGGFEGTLDNLDKFGSSVASLNDLDGDGVANLAVGAPLDDDGGTNRGAVWVLFLNQGGTVKAHQKISDIVGGFRGTLNNDDNFGGSVAGLGDLDGDGTEDLAVGAPCDNDGGLDRGAVWVLFLNPDGTVRAERKISDTAGGFEGELDDCDQFGYSVASLGDLDGDGVADLAVGAPNDDDGGTNRGAVWVLSLNQDGSVGSEQKISETAGGFQGALDDSDAFGYSVAGLGYLDGDDATELAVGSPYDDDGGSLNRGAVWVLFLNQNGTVKAEQKISDTAGGFQGKLDWVDQFGSSVASLGDLDGDLTPDLAVGAPFDDDGTPGLFADRGAVWMLFLNSDGTVKAEQKISPTAGGFEGRLDFRDIFGSSVASLGDLDEDGVVDIAVGAPGDDDGGSSSCAQHGAVWILFLKDRLVLPR